MSISPNTKKHIKDDAEFVSLAPNDNIPESIQNVQQAIQNLGSYAYLDPGLPKATTMVDGIARIATVDEVMAGVGTTTIVTPEALNKRLEHPEATTTQLGLTQYATNEEALEGVAENRSIVVSALKYVLDNTKATESSIGLAKVSTMSQAQAGTNDTTIMTPKKVAHAISLLSPAEGIATEKNTGVVILATTSQAQTGVTREGMAISPYTFKNTNASNQYYGTVRYASVDEASSGKDIDGAAISPKVFNTARATESKVGTTQLATQTETKDANINTKAVTPSGLKYYKDLIDSLQRSINDLKRELVPVGMVVSTFSRTPLGPGWVVLDKPTVDITQNNYPKLFNHLKGTIPPSNGIIRLNGGNGKVLRGKNYGQYSDVDEVAIGGFQNDASRRIHGRFYDMISQDSRGWDKQGRPGNVVGAFFHDTIKGNAVLAPWRSIQISSNDGIGFDSSRVVPTARENRVKSLTVIYQIYAG